MNKIMFTSTVYSCHFFKETENHSEIRVTSFYQGYDFVIHAKSSGYSFGDRTPLFQLTDISDKKLLEVVLVKETNSALSAYAEVSYLSNGNTKTTKSTFMINLKSDVFPVKFNNKRISWQPHLINFHENSLPTLENDVVFKSDFHVYFIAICPPSQNPTITVEKAERKITGYRLKSPTEFKCTFAGDTFVTLEWEFNGNKLTSDSKTSFRIIAENEQIPSYTSVISIDHTDVVDEFCDKFGTFMCKAIDGTLNIDAQYEFEVKYFYDEYIGEDALHPQEISRSNSDSVLLIRGLVKKTPTNIQYRYSLNCNDFQVPEENRFELRSHYGDCLLVDAYVKKPEFIAKRHFSICSLSVFTKSGNHSWKATKMIASVESCGEGSFIDDKKKCKKCPDYQWSFQSSGLRCFNSTSNCPPNYFGHGKVCTVCPVSHISTANATNKKSCVERESFCKQGTYGIQDSCRPCTLGTISDKHVAVKKEDCYKPLGVNCKANQYGYLGYCNPCPKDSISIVNTAAKEEDCFVSCESGFYGNVSGCTPCPVGTTSKSGKNYSKASCKSPLSQIIIAASASVGVLLLLCIIIFITVLVIRKKKMAQDFTRTSSPKSSISTTNFKSEVETRESVEYENDTRNELTDSSNEIAEITEDKDDTTAGPFHNKPSEQSFNSAELNKLYLNLLNIKQKLLYSLQRGPGR